MRKIVIEEWKDSLRELQRRNTQFFSEYLNDCFIQSIQDKIDGVPKKEEPKRRVYAKAEYSDGKTALCWKYLDSDTLYKVSYDCGMVDEVLEGVTFERYATGFDL